MANELPPEGHQFEGKPEIRLTSKQGLKLSPYHSRGSSDYIVRKDQVFEATQMELFDTVQ